MEILLINKEDFAPYRNLSVKVDNKQLEPYIIEAQTLDLYRYLGPTLYGQIISVMTAYEANKAAYVATEANPVYIPTTQEQDYLYLLNGRNYTNSAETLVSYRGLKAVLVYLTYSRYIREAHIFSTQAGLKINNTQYSEHVSTRDINEMAIRAENDAQALIHRVRDYIKDYPTPFNIAVSAVCGDKNNGNDPRRLRLGAVRGSGYKGKGSGCCNNQRGGIYSTQPAPVVATPVYEGLNASLLFHNDTDNSAQINLLNNL